jgi:hypothetical protein
MVLGGWPRRCAGPASGLSRCGEIGRDEAGHAEDGRCDSAGLDRGDFDAGLPRVPQVVTAARLTGEYDYRLRVVCASSAEFESVIDGLKRDHGVRALRSRLLLHEVPLGPATLLNTRVPG